MPNRQSGNQLKSQTKSTLRAGLTLAASLVALAGLAGCEVDSYMDPSVIGRWERTPTSVPILERLAAIEDATGTELEYTSPTSADLVPVAKLYRLGAGDRLEIEIYDVIEPGRPENYERTVDTRGMVELPQFGQIAIGGMTVEEARAAIARVVARLVPDPLVSLNPLSQRQQTFTLVGAVATPGPYYIPAADYRLLEALTAGGVFDSSAQYVYVIRQIQLTEEERGLRAPGTEIPEPAVDRRNLDPQGQPKDNLIDVIDEITAPQNRPQSQPQTQPQTQPPANPPQSGAPRANPGMLAEQPPATTPPSSARPAIDIDPPQPRATPAPSTGAMTPGGQWVFVNGRWVQVSQGEPENIDNPGATGILTQRIIRVSMQDLIDGRREANIVVRPGDVIRIPPPPRGVFYIGGQIARPGIFTFPEQGRMTIMRAIYSGGGLNGLAIPSRVDLTRIVGPDRQATIRLDLRAIFEQTTPDIYVKSDDIINIGTNFWATPLAVIRNGFRATYGFGFILDRNFDEEVFGLRPSQERSVFNP